MNLAWKTKASTVLGLLLFVGGARGTLVVTPWIPIFKGVERAAGTNFPSTTFTNNGVVYTDSTLQVANCVRVDLLDPDVQLFTTPRATNYALESSETYSISVSNFVKRYGVQVASVANFYQTFYDGAWRTDPPVDGLPSRIFGLSICTGQVVSVPDFGPDSNNRYASILFTTNKMPFLVLSNSPPGTNTAGIYTAVSGYYAVLTNGIIMGSSALIATYPDPTFHQVQPRTLFGLSADRRYLYMLVIDGRQGVAQGFNPPYSDGANDNDMGIWLLQFGASDGVALDGGGSSAMYMENCSGGNPIPLGRSSYAVQAPFYRERITGSQLGVYALPLRDFINDVVANPASTAVTVTWTTASNATTQVQYGLTPAFGNLSAFDATPTTNHSVTLNGLMPGTRYYYRVLSSVGGVTNLSLCEASSFSTTNFGGLLIPLTHNWKWQTNNLDGENWTALDYNDTGWPNGAACLWADERLGNLTSYTNFVPNFAAGTRMPIDPETGHPFSTYYFRTRFTYSNSLNGLSLIFSNFLDDGAIFYLNGFEVFRTNMPNGLITNDTPAFSNGVCRLSGFDNNATCPMIFLLNSNALNNFSIGTNVVAVEVHDYRTAAGVLSPDVAFESALHFVLPPPVIPPSFITNVMVAPGETTAAFTWTTLSNSTSQVLYGLTPALGSSNALNENLVSNHAMALNDLQPVTQYYFRIVSAVGTNQFTYDGAFTTASFVMPLVTSSNSWRFHTDDLSSTNWMVPTYDDSGWEGQGTALFYVEDNTAVSPRNTLLPLNEEALFPTYYFRTHFNFSGPAAGFALLFTNFIDDGAVFYLNGQEIQRVRMNAGLVSYATLANGCPVNVCEATADVPEIFRLSGDAMTNLVIGDNVLAAEVHQFVPNENDVVFGSTLALVRTLITETPLRISHSNNVVCVSWNSVGFTLQQANLLTGTNAWSDAPGPITSSPYCMTNPSTTTFFRLRN
jgi:exopolysaccharide biosynthesis protein